MRARGIRIATLGVLGVLLAFAATATARPAHRYSGVVPDNPTHARLHPPALARVANLPYGGGLVMHSNRTHLIFWQPTLSGLSFDPGYIGLVERFEANVAHDSHLPTNIYGLTGQYSDMSGVAQYDSTYAGAILDGDPLPGERLLGARGPPDQHRPRVGRVPHRRAARERDSRRSSAATTSRRQAGTCTSSSLRGASGAARTRVRPGARSAGPTMLSPTAATTRRRPTHRSCTR